MVESYYIGRISSNFIKKKGRCVLSFLSGLQRLFCFHGSRRPQGSQTDFSADIV